MQIDCAALLLDADGTLVDSTAAVERTWRAWTAEYGVDAEAVLRVCHGRRSAETVAQFVSDRKVARAVARLDELEVTDLDDVTSCPGAIKLLAARRLGVEIGRCVVIEDAPAGVQAGRAAGAVVIAVTTTHSAEELVEADAVVPSLREISVRPGALTVRTI